MAAGTSAALSKWYFLVSCHDGALWELTPIIYLDHGFPSVQGRQLGNMRC